MNLTKSARYALYAALEMALTGPDGLVTVAEVAGLYRVPEGALAKAFQGLVRAGLAHGTRGVGGGYRLARKASEVTVLDVLAIAQPPRQPGHCLLGDWSAPCEALAACRLGRLFDEVDEMVSNTFASITLATLARYPGGATAPPHAPEAATTAS